MRSVSDQCVPPILPLNQTYYLLYFLQMLSANLPCALRSVPLSFIQRIRPSPRPSLIFRNKINFLRWGIISPMSNPPNRWTISCRLPRLLIRSHPPYLEAISSVRNLRTRHAVVTRDPLTVWHKENIFFLNVWSTTELCTESSMTIGKTPFTVPKPI
jgi:hypothetical protein